MAELWIAFRRTSTVIALGILPVALLAAFVATGTRGSQRAIDLRTAWKAGAAYLHGRSPYPPDVDSFVAAGPNQSFIQTPPVAALLAPSSTLSYGVVVAVALLLLAGAVIGALWLFGVRDWRCYGAVFLCPPTLTAISIGTLTPLLLLALAIAWRWRRSRFAAGGVVGGAVAAKLLVWPLFVWLWLAGRRWTAAIGAAVAAAVLVASTAPLGLSTARLYASLLRRDSLLVGHLSYGVVSLLHIDPQVALSALEAASVAILLAAAAAGRRKLGSDSGLFAASVGLSLFLAPIVHLHYVTLLFAALAVRARPFGVAWLVPCVLWITPRQDSDGEVWRTTLVLLVALVMLLEPWRRVQKTAS